MNLEPIISALKARCPSFGNRFYAAMQFDPANTGSEHVLPCAFVTPLNDAPQKPIAINSVRQLLNDRFAVIVVLENANDEAGLLNASAMHGLRTELWGALLGWEPAPDYDGIIYEGGKVLSQDERRVCCQFDFGATMEIGSEEGWQSKALSMLPSFVGGKLSIDAIDPSDPNLAPQGPDGRMEISSDIQIK